jgi:hypothetical protein
MGARGRAPAENTDGPARVEATLIHGTPHWNLGLGWRWEEVTQHGEPVQRVTAQQRAAFTEATNRMSCIRHSLRLEPRLTERLPDGSRVIGVFAHLGDFADTTNKPIPVSVQIGTVTITARGKATLALTLSTNLPQQTHAG